jgi:hypothetical protein
MILLFQKFFRVQESGEGRRKHGQITTRTTAGFTLMDLIEEGGGLHIFLLWSRPYLFTKEDRSNKIFDSVSHIGETFGKNARAAHVEGK